jgi:hypothetical protein
MSDKYMYIPRRRQVHCESKRSARGHELIEEFVEREREFLSGGGKFIVPLPEVRVVGA